MDALKPLVQEIFLEIFQGKKKNYILTIFYFPLKAILKLS